MKNLILSVLLIVISTNSILGQLSKIKTYPNKFEKDSTTIIYGYSLDNEFVVVSLNSNFEEINTVSIPNIKYNPAQYSTINEVCGTFYIDFYDESKKNIIRIVFSNDLSTYTKYETSVFDYNSRLLGIMESQKTNPYFITEEHLSIYGYHSTERFLYVTFNKNNAISIPSHSMAFNIKKMNVVGAVGLYVYKGDPTLVKYTFSKEVVDGFLYFKFDKVWSNVPVFTSKNSDLFIENVNEETKHVMLTNSTNQLLTINCENGKLENSVMLHNFKANSIRFSSIRYIPNQNALLSLFITNSNEIIIQLHDETSKLIGKEVTISNIKIPKITHTGPSGVPSEVSINSSYYFSEKQFYMDANIEDFHLLIKVENQSIVHTILAHKSLRKIDSNYSFFSPNFIIEDGKFILASRNAFSLNKSEEKITFLNVENNTGRNYLISDVILKKNDRFPSRNSFNRHLVLGYFGHQEFTSMFFQSPSGKQILWLIVEDNEIMTNYCEYLLKVEQL